jgi:hypothetical protein
MAVEVEGAAAAAVTAELALAVNDIVKEPGFIWASDGTSVLIPPTGSGALRLS